LRKGDILPKRGVFGEGEGGKSGHEEKVKGQQKRKGNHLLLNKKGGNRMGKEESYLLEFIGDG
jgi:hypothetical protein